MSLAAQHSRPQQPPPLLLTKRLTVFLQQSIAPPLHTALLTTSTGKLLAYASPRPVVDLRTQCTVASSLWALHTAAAASIPDALPSASPSGPASPSSGPGAAAGTSALAPRSPGPGSGPAASRPASIMVQLSGGVLVIRRLRCGLLLVCVGHPPEADGAAPSSGAAPAQGQIAQGAGDGGAAAARGSPALAPGSPSEVDSVLSTGAATTASYASAASVGTAAVVVARRHAEELGRALDEKLSSLKVPDEGVGIE